MNPYDMIDYFKVRSDDLRERRFDMRLKGSDLNADSSGDIFPSDRCSKSMVEDYFSSFGQELLLTRDKWTNP